MSFRESLDRHEIGETKLAPVSLERGGEHVCRMDVSARGVVLAGCADAKPAAFACVEQAAEDGRAVEARPATPINRAVARDERGRVRVADQSVIADGSVSPCFDTHAHLQIAVPVR
jgi:hypothetical protein